MDAVGPARCLEFFEDFCSRKTIIEGICIKKKRFDNLNLTREHVERINFQNASIIATR